VSSLFDPKICLVDHCHVYLFPLGCATPQSGRSITWGQPRRIRYGRRRQKKQWHH